MASGIITWRAALLLGTGLAVAGCTAPGGGFDLDLRRSAAGTAAAARGPIEPRPRADDRGVISYPTYQVAVSRRGDTPVDVARRVGTDPAQLASFNGLPADVVLGAGEILALPGRVPEPSPATGSVVTGPIRPPGSVDITTLAGAAIDRASPVEANPGAPRTTPSAAVSGREPVRHRVERGETAFSIARLYGISVRALAEWNGLDADLTVTEGRFLLIPVVSTAQGLQPAAAESRPGAGSAAPVPPSAARALPVDEAPAPRSAAEVAAAAPAAPPPAPATSASRARLAAPVSGAVNRIFAAGRNDGVGFAAPPGSAVSAAEAGTIAAITEDTNGVPIVVIRHEGGLLTVYAGISDLSVTKGDAVTRGQPFAKVRDGGALHFEVRDGFEAVDPADYI